MPSPEEDLRRQRLMAKNNPDKIIKPISTKVKVEGETFKERGEFIIAFSPALAFQASYKHSYKSISTFLKDFMNLNDEYSTMNTDTGGKFCSPGKRRSMIDIFIITRSYFPRVGLATVVREITNNPEISSNLCQMTNRRVYYIRRGERPRHPHAEERDEFNLTLHQLREQSA